MYLKSVDILGFKSFEEKTHLKFSEGITAFLGPNGCGKSNIVDAVKWVLGEQSPKSLRADRMDDIIFKGTESRKALNVAEVVLVLSNEEEELPLGVPEISIKRRLYRSGESEYFVNNTPALLREIRELFFDTGMGKSAYSIMEQGEIDQILSTKPEERRFVFEEAAGITKYRIKGIEAERKLEKTKENMRQVSGILSEVKKSYYTLKTQAEKTEKYKKLKERIFNSELDIHLFRLKAFIEQRDTNEEKLKDKSKARNTLKRLINKINEDIGRNIDQINSMESHLIENQKKLYKIALERNNRQNQINMFKERILEHKQKINLDEERERSIKSKLSRVQEDQKSKTADLKDIKSLLIDVEANIQGFERDIVQFEKRIQENEHGTTQLHRDSAALERDVETNRLDLRRITDNIVTQLDQRLKELGYSIKEREKTEEEIVSALESIKIQITGRLNLLKDMERVGGLFKDGDDRVFRSTLSVLDDILKKTETLGKLFIQYKGFTPSFLEEFLAPEGIITQKRRIDHKINDILDSIAHKRKQLDALLKENKSLNGKIVEYRHTLEGLRVNRARMYTQKDGLENEVKRLGDEAAEQESHLDATSREIELSKQHLKETEEKISLLEVEKNRLEREDGDIKKELTALEGKIARSNDKLISREQKLKSQIEKLEQVQRDLEKLQMRLAEIKAEIRNLYQNFSEHHSRSLADFESRMFQIDAPLKLLKNELSTHRDKLKKLGQINLMAPEEFAEVNERYQFLTGQLQDLEKASEDLKKVTMEIRTESSELFLKTYKSIKKNFHIMFRRLFGGGRAELGLTNPEDVLESGIEIYAQPPGKKLENITLLSGGEKSLTAIALLFATYMVKPSPFCILDEIDAALDDQNVIHFVNILKEFSGNSQFLVITHNKKTIACANNLLGVTMEESGVSKIVTLRLENKLEEKNTA